MQLQLTKRQIELLQGGLLFSEEDAEYRSSLKGAANRDYARRHAVNLREIRELKTLLDEYFKLDGGMN